MCLKDNTLFFSKPYPVPIHYREIVEKQINKMLMLGIIRPSQTNYIKPMVVVPKKNDDIRLYLDAQKIIAKLMDDYESTPSEVRRKSEEVSQKKENTIPHL